MPRIAVFQMNSGIDPKVNTAAIIDALQQAKQGGAAMLFTPEMCTLLDQKRSRAAPKIEGGETQVSLQKIQSACAKQAVGCVLGSIALPHPSGKFVNRSIVVDDQGAIAATYDKIHMFDVDLESGESWRESNAYEPGETAVSVETAIGRLGLCICYDIRFPALFQAFGVHNCDLLSIPAAFTVPTGQDHWHIMQRARAIEASAYVVAAAQAGTHEDGRSTYGHSLVLDPWGEVLLDMEKQVGVGFAEIDQERITEVRRQLPSLANRREIPNSTVR